jgi:hypothetical protein
MRDKTMRDVALQLWRFYSNSITTLQGLKYQCFCMNIELKLVQGQSHICIERGKVHATFSEYVEQCKETELNEYHGMSQV